MGSAPWAAAGGFILYMDQHWTLGQRGCDVALSDEAGRRGLALSRGHGVICASIG